MRVTQVGIQPTEASVQAGRPALTPELLAASGARYSRNNEGLQSILDRIDPDNLDRSVDAIFRMIDYGHQSIADMAPVAMFIDGISIWLAYVVWTLCPTAGGQESSTRYIRLTLDDLIPADALGIPAGLQQEWQSRMQDCLTAYENSLTTWEALALETPGLARIPRALLDDPSDRASRQVARMKRNYGFDRARYFLPAAAATNMMLIMSARGWVQLCQHLLSHPLPEAARLGETVGEELALAAPRMLRHATAKDSIASGIRQEWEQVRSAATLDPPVHLLDDSTGECPAGPFLEHLAPAGVGGPQLAEDLRFHDNRYAWLGPDLRRTMVRFGWRAAAMGEIRDLNRHRTGTRYCPMRPQGFYAALDQVPHEAPEAQAVIRRLAEAGRAASRRSHELLSQGEPSYVYWSVLGTQFPFEHDTTADKFIYEAELRTGTGAHYRYAAHLRQVLELWYRAFPETRGLVLEGSAEPE